MRFIMFRQIPLIIKAILIILSSSFIFACSGGGGGSDGGGNGENPPINNYTVSFYDNGDILTQFNRNVAGGTQITLPTLTKANYTFNGWLLNGTGNPLTGSYTVSANTTFVAKWTAIGVTEYTVSFYDNGVILPEYGTTAASGTQITLPAPTKANHTFNGWLINNAGNPITGSYTVNGNVSFHAKFTAIQYTVNYYDEDSILIPELSGPVNAGTDIALPNRSKANYTFDGWLINNARNPLTGSYTVNGNVSFHAQFTAIQYTVNYYDEDSILISELSGQVNAGTYITLPNRSKLNYNFDGWLKNNAGSPLNGTYTVTENVSFHAKWTALRYTVSYYDENGYVYSDIGGESTHGDTVTLPTRTKNGHTFDGWLKDNAGTPLNGTYTVTENVSFHAKWTALRYTVSYYDENGHIYSDIGGESTYGDTVTLPARTKDGHTFDGWLKNNTGTPLNGSYTVTENVSFRAKWTPLQYTVSYYDENGQLYNDISGPVNYGNIVLPARIKAGHRFDGWSIDNIGSTINGTYTVTEAVSFYAKWTVVYTVSYYDAYGQKYTDIGEEGLTYGSTVTLPTRERADYIFNGWLENNTGPLTVGTYTITEDVSFYANFTLTGATPITSAAELYQIRNNLSGKYILLNNISLAGYNTGSGWDPIGTFAAPFTGILDGNGFKITDLRVDYRETTGLFGNIGGGAIISNLTVEISSSGVKGASVGGIAGRIDATANNKAVISNVHIRGTGVVQGSSAGSPHSGGIAGSVRSAALFDCSNTVNVTSDGSSGGMIGYVWGDVAITNCYNTGDVTSYLPSFIIPSTNTYFYSGGMVGYLSYNTYPDITITITNCYNTGDVTSSYSPSSSSSSYSYSSYSYAGGMVGYLDFNTTNTTITITNCYNTGNVTSSSVTSGGMVGYVNGDITITNCYNTGDVTSSYSGGIVGYAYSNTMVTITNCYNTGDVTSSYSGGIVGYSAGIAIISGNYSLGTVTGDSSGSSSSIRLGGIAGYIANGSVTNNAAINPELKTTSSSSDISFARIGNFNLTSTNLTVTNNFALDSMLATGGSFGADSAVNGIGKTEAELKTRVTYENAVNGNGFGGLGWQFGNDDDHPWKMPAGGTGFSILYWQ